MQVSKKPPVSIGRHKKDEFPFLCGATELGGQGVLTVEVYTDIPLSLTHSLTHIHLNTNTPHTHTHTHTYTHTYTQTHHTHTQTHTTHTHLNTHTHTPAVTRYW
jgi:hypothetical protein